MLLVFVLATIGAGSYEYFGGDIPIRLRQTLAFVYGFDVGGGFLFVLSLLGALSS